MLVVAPPALFESAELSARELPAHEVPRLQALLDANPAFSLTVNGRPFLPDEAQEEFDSYPPAGLGFTRRHFLGLSDRSGELAGLAVVFADFCAPAVWHVSFFLLAEALHGRGVGARAWHALEAWMASAGARWVRLGVVVGNAPGERFWARMGFADVHLRRGMDTGGRINDIRILARSLRGEALEAYLELVPRDRPE